MEVQSLRRGCMVVIQVVLQEARTQPGSSQTGEVIKHRCIQHCCQRYILQSRGGHAAAELQLLDELKAAQQDTRPAVCSSAVAAGCTRTARGCWR